MKISTNRKSLLNQATSESFDIIIIGGGITGAGIFRDFSLRGKKVLLVEKNDFASGTSSKSGKLVHGGLRYLKYLKFKLVFESILERYRLRNYLAKGMVKPTKFTYIFTDYSKNNKYTMFFGLLVYEILALFRSFAVFKFTRLKSMHSKIKHLTNKVTGGAEYYDCMVLDTRLVLENIKSGLNNGGVALNYLSVKSINLDSSLKSVSVYDEIAGESFKLNSKVIVNATGPSADVIQEMVGAEKFNLKNTQGIHLVLKDKITLPNTLTIEHPDDFRPLYLTPLFKNRILLGATDKTKSDAEDISKEDIDYLFSALDEYFKEANFNRSDIVSIYSGIRPLMGSDKNLNEVELPRDDKVLIDKRGLLSITGGKLTTFRKMAKKVVDLTLKEFFNEKIPCKTISPLSIKNGEGHCKYFRYGNSASDIRVEENLSEIDYSMSEFDYICQYELPTSLSDILMRRTDIFFANPKISNELLIKIAKTASKYLDWDNEEIQNQIINYNNEVNKMLEHTYEN